MMKKVFKLLFVLFIISVISMTQLPVVAVATTAINTIQNVKPENKKESVQYTEGEAVIMYRKSDYAKKLKTSSIFKDIKIENSIEFENVDIDLNDVKTMSLKKEQKKVNNVRNNPEEDLVVSLVSSNKSSDELVKLLKKDPNVIFAQKNYKYKIFDITNDTYSKYQWALENNGQNAGTDGMDINPKKTSDEKEKVIAIVDSGVDYDHPDLQNVMWNNTYGNDLKGEHGYNFTDDDIDIYDDIGHGTHCAGIIAAQANNQDGISGATLDANNVKIMALKVCDYEGYIDTYRAIKAYDYINRAQQLGTNIVAVNNSWGGATDDTDSILETAIDIVGKNGALSICAAGNESTDIDEDFSTLVSPAGLYSDYIISVAASNEKDELASFSNYGEYSVDIAAPGTNILSTISYNVFNPSIYTEEQRTQICNKYENFDSGLNSFEHQQTAETTVEADTDTYFGQKGGKSLKWSILDCQKGVYRLAFPYSKEGESYNNYSMMLRTTCDEYEIGYISIYYYAKDYDSISNIDDEDIFGDDYGNIETLYDGYISNQNYWEHISRKLDNYHQNGTIIIEVDVSEMEYASIYIDDFAISKDDVDEEKFGKYEFMNGTSMATPFVTAAVATVSNLYKNDDMNQVKYRIIGSARESEDIKSPGTINLENLENVYPIILDDDIKIDENGKITIPGYFFGDNPKLYINDQEINTITYDKEKGIITYINSDLKNKFIETIKVVTEDEKEDESYGIFLKTGKLLNKEGYEETGALSYVTTDGKDIYGYKDSQLFTISPNNTSSKQVLDTGKDLLKLFENSSLQETYISCRGLQYNNGKIWSILELDAGYVQENILVSYNINAKDGWKKVCKLGNEYIDGSTFAVYNSQLYLIGGYDSNYNETRNVYIYDENNNTWDSGATLPKPVSEANAIQVNDKLVLYNYEYGESESNIYVFNGIEWKESANKAFLKDIYSSSDYSIALVKDGVIISGCYGNGVAESFKYNINNDTYEPIEYISTNNTYYYNLKTVSVNDKLYAFISEYVEESDNYTEILKSMPIESGLIDMNANIASEVEVRDQNNNIINSGVTKYLPGQKVELTVTPKNGYKIKSFKVNGTPVNGNTYSCCITSNMNVEVESELIIKDISQTSISGIKDKDYTGKALTLQIVVKDGNVVLREGTDYVLSYKNNKNPGKATVTITGIGNYTGSIKKTFNIKVQKVTGLKVKSQTTTSIKLSWSKATGVSGYRLYKYNSSKKKWETVTTTSSTSYTVKKLKAGTTYKFRIRAYKTINGKKNFGEYTKKITTGTKTSTPKISKITSKSKKATLTWKKVSGATGYRVYMATSKKGKYSKVKTITSSKTVKYTKSSLKKNKTYYFKIRTYKTVDGKKIFSSYSSIKKIKIK